ncbi:MAG: DUF885 domain-containing protein [Planctomycetota bacterium]
MRNKTLNGVFCLKAVLTASALLVIVPAANAQTEATTQADSAGVFDVSPKDALHQIFKAYDEWSRASFPESAMRRGDYRFADRITDQSIVAIERRYNERIGFLDQLNDIDRNALDEQDQISFDFFELILRQDIDGHRFRTFLAPISGRSGPHQSIPQMADGVRFRSVEDYENYLRRMEQSAQSVSAYIQRMKLGCEEGRVPPRVAVESVPTQIASLLAPGGLDSLGIPFQTFPDHIPARARDRFRNQYRNVALPSIRNALNSFGEYVTNEYVPACRETVAANDWPDGEAYYNHQLRVMTTTRLSAQDIHDIGISEVARIRAEMMEVIARSDFLELFPAYAEVSADEQFAAFRTYLRTDPRFYYDNPEDLLANYRRICKEVDPWMIKLFKSLPRLPYGVAEIPSFMAPSQTTAYYQPGNLENGEPGYFYANTYALDQRPKYEMIALTLHEAVPGHHHQISLAAEIEDLPPFRRQTYLTAYGEGWALYAERLGIEMGLYSDPYDDFGRLTYEMWRATRLVVDTGMHALGWSRDDAIKFMLDNTALSELNITNEVDRYIAWPGQACGYKIGELRIRALRERAEKMLGADFDLREFHDVVLTSGAIPLPVLQKRVDAWLLRQVAPQQYD